MKRKKHEGVKLIHPDKPWTAWLQAEFLVDADGRRFPVPPGVMVVKNNHYEVHIRPQEAPAPFGQVVWLSVKRCDRRIIRDWRDLQRIKNELVGPEVEAVELFPAEDRLVDTANQYHLFVFTNGYRMPFGYSERLVLGDTRTTDPLLRNARQRPFRTGERREDAPPVLNSPTEAEHKVQDAWEQFRGLRVLKQGRRYG